jgi:adenine-specific DNA-methyltransferase
MPSAPSEVKDYRHDEKRKNSPESGLITYAREKKERKHYEYNPHLDPQLIWAGKKENTSFDIDTVSIHIHERISTQAILKSILRKPEWIQTTLNMFAEPDLPLDKRIEFYQHNIDWSNRLILGDSVLVMNSLLERELMAGKVQMIYMDPPYGIKYNSNFQPSILDKDVQDGKDEDLTREPEQIKAYRDTWELNIHSYLTYMRDRLLLARELLAESGSCFVQISDENLHHVREIMDEIFGSGNFISIIVFRKKGMTLGKKTLENMYDFIIWYAKNKDQIKYHQLFTFDDGSEARWDQIELSNGSIRATTKDEKDNPASIPKGAKLFNPFPTNSPTFDKEAVYPVQWKEKTYHPLPNQSWITRDKQKILRLLEIGRMFPYGASLAYKQYLSDFPYKKLTSVWHDTRLTGKIYSVQTATKVIQRCMLMTTDPGDLVLDPTCGSGTAAYVAEQWGRRWITCDTSRVAIAIAKQRLMTAVFEYYFLSHPEEGIRGGLSYRS